MYYNPLLVLIKPARESSFFLSNIVDWCIVISHWFRLSPCPWLPDNKSTFFCSGLACTLKAFEKSHLRTLAYLFWCRPRSVEGWGTMFLLLYSCDTYNACDALTKKKFRRQALWEFFNLKNVHLSSKFNCYQRSFVVCWC